MHVNYVLIDRKGLFVGGVESRNETYFDQLGTRKTFHEFYLMHEAETRLPCHADVLRLVTLSWGGTRDKPKNICVTG